MSAIIQLRRTSRKDKAVRGAAAIPIGADTILCATLENADYIIPDGTYPISVTYSPRFQKNIPFIDKVPKRSGIRIHTGTRPEHSQGCVLVNARDKEAIIEYLTKNKQNNEETRISISSAY